MPTTLTDSDSLTLVDAVATQLGTPFSRAGGDNIFLSDSTAFLISILSKPSDQLTLLDSLTIQRSIAFALADQLTLSDDAGAPILVVQLLLILSDSISLSDASSAVASDSLDLYLRRYLNDVA